MKLQRLELFGFKSFADRVAIEFNPGITAIVGPNGCGKSNISDAIRWVLGEQRPTLVRGSRMDEVIFSGSRHRKPINLAEVALHFSNEDGLLPIEYTEVAIARRVFRDGDSDYLLNRHPCRLKDIQDLLMGTGIGTHSYTLIQQGMVDSLLSDRPEERRTIFEEAAGVTRYKNRRRATQRKLEATAIDLDRVEDVVSEVDRNVASLKRQVGKASARHGGSLSIKPRKRGWMCTWQRASWSRRRNGGHPWLRSFASCKRRNRSWRPAWPIARPVSRRWKSS